MATRRTALATVLAALVLAAGCGGDDGGGGAEALTASEYRKQGNALCQRAKAEVERLPPPTSPDGLADYLEKSFDIAFDVNDEFEELDPPEELRETHSASVGKTEEARDKFDAVVEAVRRSDNPFQTLQSELRKLTPLLEENEELNRKLGLDECNEMGTTSGRPDAS